MVEFMRTLLKVNVFIFDYSGYGLSRGTPSEEQFYRDGQDAIDFVESRNDLGKNGLHLQNGLSYRFILYTIV